MKDPLVSIIIVTMNGLGYLKMVMPSLAKEKYKNKEVVIVDNGSTDGSIEYIKQNYPDTKLVLNTTNNGFAGANNQGYKLAKGKYVFLLNNDTKVSSNLFKPMIDFMEKNPQTGACQPRVLRLEDSKRLDSVGSYFTKTGFLFHFGFGAIDSKKLRQHGPLFSAKGCALLLRKSLTDRIGLFDDDYFAYFEETDLCWRIWLSGYDIRYIYETYILHKGWGTSGKMNFSFINYHSYKNRMVSLIKNLERKNLIYVLTLNVLLSIGASLAYLFKAKIKEFWSIWRAFFWIISNIDLISKKRSKIQKLRTVRDSEFLPRLTQKVNMSYFYHLFTGLEKYKPIGGLVPFYR